MRGELPAALLAVGRASGIAGLVTAAAGVVAVVATTQPWHEAAAELTMLGAADERAVVAVLGWRTAPGLIAGVAGVVVAALGLALAVDRHPGWTRPALLIAAATLAAAGTDAQLRRPELDGLPDDGGALADLREVASQLPRDVELALTVRPGGGAVLVLLAGVLVLVAVACARELDAH